MPRILLQQAAREGHCYLAIEELNRRSCELLGSEADAIEQMILPLTEEGRIAIEHTQEDVDDNRCIFPVALHQSETTPHHSQPCQRDNFLYNFVFGFV